MTSTNAASLLQRLGGAAELNKLIAAVLSRMHDDYRINRFFSDRDLTDKTHALHACLAQVLNGTNTASTAFSECLDDVFMTLFAKNNKKRSLVSGADFAIIAETFGGQEVFNPKPLCDAHTHLLKYMPDDFHYDVLIEHLTAAVQQAGLAADLRSELLTLAVQARDGILGRS